jgi:CRP-like cAMP-binding protein
VIEDALRATAHFRKLPDEALSQLAGSFAERELESGVAVYEAGDPADALYVVARGTVVTFRDRAQDGSRPLARLRGGDLVGVADFFDSDQRSETARTTEASVLLRAAGRDLLSFLESHPQVELNLRLAAARDLTARAKISLAVAQRRVVRHRINQDVRLVLPQGAAAQATLIDLSPLGMALRGAPDSWRPGDVVRYRLTWRDRRLGLVGRVAWREDDYVGIELREPTPGIQLELQQTLEQMLSCAA